MLERDAEPRVLERGSEDELVHLPGRDRLDARVLMVHVDKLLKLGVEYEHDSCLEAGLLDVLRGEADKFVLLEGLELALTLLREGVEDLALIQVTFLLPLLTL